MRRLPNFTRTMVAVLAICVVIFTCMMYFVSGALARSTVQRMAREEAGAGLEAGLALLRQRAAGQRSDEAVRGALDPAVNPAEVYLYLRCADGTAFAARGLGKLTAEALAFAQRAGEEIAWRQSGDLLLAARAVPEGVAVAVKSLAASNAAEISFRSMMLPYALLGLAFMGVAVLLLALRIMTPVDTLVSAARRISEGEEPEISEKLPVELRPLGRAFNQMSRRLSSSMQQLTDERDTLSQVIESLDEGVLAVYRPLASGQGALAVLRDVTEHERLERTRRDYVANISHELRTPLSSMRGITEGLRDGLVTDDAERQRCYELLLGEVQRLSRLVNDLLELSNLQSNPAAFSVEPVDALETLYELADRTRTLAKRKGVELILDAPEALPSVITNEDRLQQVLTILLDNAIKFTPAGGKITLSAAEEGRFVRFSVRDTGIGMDAYTQEHAFDRFHQADSSHSLQGSGLGLAIAREIMQRLDGHIGVKSKPGAGSEFFFLMRVDGQD